jgi:hypothetical protein
MRAAHWLLAVACGVALGLLVCAVASGGLAPTPAAAAAWSIQRAAVPAQPNGSLDAVSCPNRRWCAAVGTFTDSNYVSRPLWEVLDGTRWRMAPSNDAVPGGFVSGEAVHGGFGSISCVSPRFCVAVGTEGLRQDLSLNLAARWNGRRWSALPSPPIGVSAVSCVTATACIAVGQGAVGWNGRRWSLQALIDPGAALAAVSCVNASFCVAVGFSNGGILDGPSTALTER